jgi:hypothetical protein
MLKPARLPHGLLAAALIALACGAGAPASAQQQHSVTLTGTAGLRCTLDQPELASTASTNFDAPAGNLFGITELGDPGTLTTKAASITLSMDAMCNSVHRVIIASDGNGLWRAGPATPAAGFASAIPYRANLVWADEQHALNAQANQRRLLENQILVGHPNTGEMLLEFEIDAGATNAGTGAPLLAGEYSDVLRVTVEAQ